jgi:hypothetical protein
MWKSLALTAVMGAAAIIGSAPETADARVRVYSGPRGTYVRVGGPAYRRAYYPNYGYSYGYATPYVYSTPTYGYVTPYYGGSYGYYGYAPGYYGPRYVAPRGAYIGPNRAVFYGPRGSFRVRY